MMTEAAPLNDLAQRISAQAAELARLREEFNSRRKLLKELTRQKHDLQKQLEKVEAQILGVGEASLPAPAPAPTHAPAPAADGNGISLPKFLVALVRELKRPVTAKDLTLEVVRRKFPTKSKNLAAMVETRLSELVSNGQLKRTPEKTLLPGNASTVMAKATTTAKPTAPVKVGGSTEKKTLKEMIAETLSQSARPLTTAELAEAILRTGYKTKSADFKNVIWVGIGNMKNVERIPGVGYRLKGKK